MFDQTGLVHNISVECERKRGLKNEAGSFMGVGGWRAACRILVP